MYRIVLYVFQHSGECTTVLPFRFFWGTPWVAGDGRGVPGQPRPAEHHEIPSKSIDRRGALRGLAGLVWCRAS